jgi:citrate synthase
MKGLKDVIAASSSITFIDGINGRLLYRGYDIESLVQNSTYEETTYLLWYGKLPTENELKEFTNKLASKRSLPEGVTSILASLPKNCDLMDALKIGVASLGIFDDPNYSMREKAISINSKIGTVAAFIHRHKNGLPVIQPKKHLSFAQNFLYMISGKVPDEFSTKLMDVMLILHADHELNASTFAARIVASTLSDVYSAIVAAIGTLKGPLHGGANEKVMEMVQEIITPERAEGYVLDRLAKKQKIMGFGHRVYRTEDPRARILKEYAMKLTPSNQDRTRLQILLKLVEVMKREKGIYPNVDLFSGFVLNHLSIPTYFFTTVFAVGRTPGWLAHILEQYDDNRIMRPIAEYTGPRQAVYLPIEQRQTNQTSSRFK